MRARGKLVRLGLRSNRFDSNRRVRFEPSVRFESIEYSLYSSNIRSSTNPRDINHVKIT